MKFGLKKELEKLEVKARLLFRKKGEWSFATVDEKTYWGHFISAEELASPVRKVDYREGIADPNSPDGVPEGATRYSREFVENVQREGYGVMILHWIRGEDNNPMRDEEAE